MSGAAGTALSNILVYPLDLVVTRLQVQRQIRKSFAEAGSSDGEYKGVIDALYKIYNKEGGLRALYAGVVQDTGKSVTDAFLFFLFYNYFRDRRLRSSGSNTSLPVLDELAVGALAGAASRFFTTPISNIVTRKQTASMVSSTSPPSVKQIADEIRAEKGYQGFWSGYSASLVLTLNPSITFFLYESFKRLLPASKRENPSAATTFLMAALSKSIASVATYPFSLAKARSQISSKPPVNSKDAKEAASEVRDASDKDSAQRAGKTARRTAFEATIFASVLNIYRSEGTAGLYEGVYGEILKGFFSHGITMLVKEGVHSAVIKLYYFVLRAMKRYPGPDELKSRAEKVVSDGYEKAGEVVSGSYAKAGEMVNGTVDAATGAGQKAGEVVSGGYAKAGDVVSGSYVKAGEMVNGTVDAATGAGQKAGEVVSQSYQQGKDAVSGTVDAATSAGQQAGKTVSDGYDSASKEAGHLMGNAREQIGGKVVDVGKGIKPDDSDK